MKALFNKDVQTGIKNHWSVEDFCEKYECTREEFIRQLARIYKNSNGILKEIETSAKKGKAHRKDKAEPEPQPIPEPTDIAESSDEAFLRELRRAETELHEEIYDLELTHAQHRKLHHDYRCRIRAEKRKIDELTTQLGEAIARVEGFVSSDECETSKMNEISAIRREKKSTLEGIENKILELTKPKVYVEIGGGLSFLRGKEVRIDEPEAWNIALELFENGHFDIYTMAALKQASYAIALTKHLGPDIDIDFADIDVGLIYLDYLEMSQSN